MGGADFCKFSHAFRHGLLLSEHILQISPGKNDNLHLVTATSTAQGPGSIGLSLVVQGRPPQASLICGFCPLAREFALRWTFQPPQSGFLRIPSRDGHPCLWLTVPATESVVDFHCRLKWNGLCSAWHTTSSNFIIKFKKTAWERASWFPRVFRRGCSIPGN